MLPRNKLNNKALRSGKIYIVKEICPRKMRKGVKEI